jgi:hypothetical protein
MVAPVGVRRRRDLEISTENRREDDECEYEPGAGSNLRANSSFGAGVLVLVVWADPEH